VKGLMKIMWERGCSDECKQNEWMTGCFWSYDP